MDIDNGNGYGVSEAGRGPEGQRAALPDGAGHTGVSLGLQSGGRPAPIPEQKMGAGRGTIADWFNPADARLPSLGTPWQRGNAVPHAKGILLAWHGRRR